MMILFYLVGTSPLYPHVWSSSDSVSVTIWFPVGVLSLIILGGRSVFFLYSSSPFFLLLKRNEGDWC